MTNYLRAYLERGDAGGDEGPIRFVASTENIGRDGLIIEAAGWQLANYRRNPVVLWTHDYRGDRLPIGRADVEIDTNRKALLADVTFDPDDEFARAVERKYRSGFLNAVSVGWQTLALEPAKNEKVRARVTKAELLDISAVPVPGDPHALQERELHGLRDLEGALRELLDEGDPAGSQRGGTFRQGGDAHRGAIAPHTTAKADEDAAWDGPGEVARAEGREQLRRMHAWVEDGAEPDSKRAYKLPHHLAESGQVVWRGVAAAMARLLQAGTQIPDGDRRGVYNHLARHYRQFDREPPEFRSAEELEALGADEIRGLFLEGEPALLPEMFGVEAPAAARLSDRTFEDLERAAGLIQGVLARARLDESHPVPPERGQGDDALARLHAIFTRNHTTDEGVSDDQDD